MHRCAVHLLALCAAVPLAGCATNAIRLESAGATQTSSREAVKAANGWFDAIEQRRRDAAAALVASDPSCLPMTSLRIQVPRASSAAQAPLCLDGDTPAAGYVAFDIDIGTSPRDILEPRLALLAAIADYVDALATILDEPKADVAAEITAFADQVDRVGRFANVAGTDLPDVNAAAATEQGQGLIGLIAFAAELAREARRTEAVRALVLERGDVVDRALSKIHEQVDGWGRGAARNAEDLYGNALFRTYLRNRRDLTAEQREQLAGRIFASREAARQVPARAATVAEAVDLARKAQAGLRDALAGKLTRDQRRAAARLNLDRITRALGLVASLARPA